MLGSKLIKAVSKDESGNRLQGWNEDRLEWKGPAVQRTEGMGPGVSHEACTAGKSLKSLEYV